MRVGYYVALEGWELFAKQPQVFLKLLGGGYAVGAGAEQMPTVFMDGHFVEVDHGRVLTERVVG